MCVCVCRCAFAGVWCACVQGVHIEECFIVLGLLCMHIVLMGACSSIVTHTPLPHRVGVLCVHVTL